MKNKLLVIEGPTASGKTALAVQLAKFLNTCVFSADSRQFYKEMEIGTAKPDLKEQQGVLHYFINSHSIHKPISAADFVREALPLLQKEFLLNEYIVLVGGSGLYIDALCKGLDDIPTDSDIQTILREEYTQFGIEPLLNELCIKDAVYFNQVDRSNSARVIRALEVIRLTGLPYSSFLKSTVKEKRSFESIYFVINLDRDRLYKRINNRMDVMVQNGLLEEINDLYPYRHLQSLQTVGYSEFFSMLEHKISFEEALDLAKRNSRRYAKRQLTWFRRNESTIWLEGQTIDTQLNEVLCYLQLPQIHKED
jgi:tRNA dimethylallyltransferase